MHVHGTQINPYPALDALRSAQRAEARREAELVRKGLTEAASELAGESDLSDACVVQLEDREEGQEPHHQQKRRDQQKEQNRPKSEQPQKDSQQEQRESPLDAEEGDSHLSDWA
jgi:hypothetical protein